MSYYKDLNDSMLRPSEIIGMQRPLLAISHKGLQEHLDYLEDEILSRGGLETMSRVTRGTYELEMSGIFEEMSYRN